MRQVKFVYSLYRGYSRVAYFYTLEAANKKIQHLGESARRGGWLMDYTIRTEDEQQVLREMEQEER